MKSISEFGFVTADGRIKLPMNRLKPFLQENRNKRLIVTVEAGESGTSELMEAYYNNYVLPTIQQALFALGDRKSRREINEWLRGEYPLESEDMYDFLEWLKQYAAERLSVYVEDPRSI